MKWKASPAFQGDDEDAGEPRLDDCFLAEEILPGCRCKRRRPSPPRPHSSAASPQTPTTSCPTIPPAAQPASSFAVAVAVAASRRARCGPALLRATASQPPRRPRTAAAAAGSRSTRRHAALPPTRTRVRRAPPPYWTPHWRAMSSRAPRARVPGAKKRRWSFRRPAAAASPTKDAPALGSRRLAADYGQPLETRVDTDQHAVAVAIATAAAAEAAMAAKHAATPAARLSTSASVSKRVGGGIDKAGRRRHRRGRRHQDASRLQIQLAERGAQGGSRRIEDGVPRSSRSTSTAPSSMASSPPCRRPAPRSSGDAGTRRGRVARAVAECGAAALGATRAEEEIWGRPPPPGNLGGGATDRKNTGVYTRHRCRRDFGRKPLL